MIKDNLVRRMADQEIMSDLLETARLAGPRRRWFNLFPKRSRERPPKVPWSTCWSGDLGGPCHPLISRRKFGIPQIKNRHVGLVVERAMAHEETGVPPGLSTAQHGHSHIINAQ